MIPKCMSRLNDMGTVKLQINGKMYSSTATGIIK